MTPPSMHGIRDSNNVPRNKGRFASYKPVTDTTQLQIAKRVSYTARKGCVKKTIYDEYFKYFFLKGEKSDWLPTSCNSGPLVTLSDTLFRPSFHLSRTEFSVKVHLVFFGGDPSKVKSIRERISTRDASFSSGAMSRIKKFTGRRLPYLENYSCEIEPLQAWLEDLLRRGALRFSSVQAAFTACLDKIKSYVWVNGRRAYIGYPKPLSVLPSRMEGAHVVEREGLNEGQESQGSEDELRDAAREMTLTVSGPSSSSCEKGRSASDDHGEDVSVTQNIGSSEESDGGYDPDVSGSHELFTMAQDDSTYRFFSLLFDESINAKFELASGLILQQDRARNQKMAPLLKEAVLYVHWKAHGIKDPVAHEKRERKLKAIAGSLTLMRETYGMKTFSEIRQEYE